VDASRAQRLRCVRQGRSKKTKYDWQEAVEAINSLSQSRFAKADGTTRGCESRFSPFFLITSSHSRWAKRPGLSICAFPSDIEESAMPLNVLTHPWDVQDLATISTLIDELIESGQPNLSLDFAEVNVLPALVVGKLFALESKLQPDFPCSSIGGSEDCFVVYVRDGLGAAWWPENIERPVAACPTYKEAARLRETIRQAGRSCVVRFIGDTGGGD
jgi:hypothetical protein